VGALPAVAGWRLASLPRGLDAEVVTRLLNSCDRDTIVGRRDHAILMLLARWGLRRAEIAGPAGRRRQTGAPARSPLRGRRNRLGRLPPPIDVGEAMVADLTARRPVCDPPLVLCQV
jgi:integrase